MVVQGVSRTLAWNTPNEELVHNLNRTLKGPLRIGYTEFRAFYVTRKILVPIIVYTHQSAGGAIRMPVTKTEKV